MSLHEVIESVEIGEEGERIEILRQLLDDGEVIKIDNHYSVE